MRLYAEQVVERMVQMKVTFAVLPLRQSTSPVLFVHDYHAETHQFIATITNDLLQSL